jgi:branched-chain amino acid aminotransferase
VEIWINNKIISAKNARVSVFDRGFMYGDGVFETMRSYGGRVFGLNAHMDRIANSLKVVKIKIPYSKAFIEKELYRLLKVNNLKDAYIRLMITRGEGTVGLAKIDCALPTVVIFVKRFTPYPAKMYKNGISIKIVKVRQNENSPVSGIKSISFLNYILARLEAKEGGFDDGIMLNSKGMICESTISNIFLIRKNQLATPPKTSGILPGITRDVILKLACKIGLKAKEKNITPQELCAADEVFLTNSLMEVMPVVKVGDKVIGIARPGPLTKRIHLEYIKSVVSR